MEVAKVDGRRFMFSFSVYSIHQLIAQVLLIWRRAQTIAEWLTHRMTTCCRFWKPSVPYSIPSDKDDISSYKISASAKNMEEGQQRLKSLPASESELMLRNPITQETDLSDSGVATSSQSMMVEDPAKPFRPQLSFLHSESDAPPYNPSLRRSSFEAETSDSGIRYVVSRPTPPLIYIEEACGEPRGQQIIVDFTSTPENVEREIRSQDYELMDSGQEIRSQDLTSESDPEPRVVRGQGDYITRKELQEEFYNSTQSSSLTPSSETEDSRDQIGPSDHQNDTNIAAAQEAKEEMDDMGPATSAVLSHSITNETSSTTWEMYNSDSLQVQDSTSTTIPSPNESSSAPISTDPHSEHVNVASTKNLQMESHVAKTESHVYDYEYTFIESFEFVIVERESGEMITMSVSPTSSFLNVENNFPAIHATREIENGLNNSNDNIDK